MPDKRDLIVHSSSPYNAEPRLDRLPASFRTAQADFYVRCHGAIPDVDPDAYRLAVGGRVRHTLTLRLQDLQETFAQRSVVATLQCAGNRRADMLRLAPVSGDPWLGGAIGNAEWTGVCLADVLEAAGAAKDDGFHVAFDCLDRCELDGHRFDYGVSIPINKALSSDVLLALSMNGAPLGREHGAPLRAIVPGFAGARSAKWLAGITVQPHPSAGYIQRHEYKLFPPGADKATADPEVALTINEMPLNSAICEPLEGATCRRGAVTLRGWAIATERAIARVDVSADEGRSWQQAELARGEHRHGSWTFWEAAMVLEKGQHQLAVRAWDSAGQTQPATVDDTWNFKGYLAASWHRVRIQVV